MSRVACEAWAIERETEMAVVATCLLEVGNFRY